MASFYSAVDEGGEVLLLLLLLLLMTDWPSSDPPSSMRDSVRDSRADIYPHTYISGYMFIRKLVYFLRHFFVRHFLVNYSAVCILLSISYQ